MTNQIEELKEKIATMQHNLKVLEKLEAQKTDVEKSYRDAYGHYPETSSFAMGDWDAVSWDAFQKGYEASKNNCEDISKVLIEGDDAYIMGVKYQRVEEPYCPDEPKITDEVVNKMLKEWEENPPEFLKFEMGKTLEELITDWLDDWDGEVDIAVLIQRIEKWLPEPQSHEGTQDVSVIDLVDGYNDALIKIKSKLRRKK